MEVRAAVFLDKDGTLINDVPYNIDPEKITLAANAVEGLMLLQEQGFRLIIVSNQSGVARGYFEPQALQAVEWRLRTLLADQGVRLDGFYYCPHHPEGKVPGYSVHCDCRKPQPGMLLRAAAEHEIDLSRSWMLGDILDDVEAGHRAGCRAVVIDNGNEDQWVPGPLRTPDFSAPNINAAAAHILEQMKLTHENAKRIPA